MVIHRGRIRAADRLDDLRRRRVSVYRVRHAGPPLEHYGQDVEVVSTDDVVTLNAANSEAASRVAGQAAQAGRSLLELSERAPTLEEVFIKLTTGREDGA